MQSAYFSIQNLSTSYDAQSNVVDNVSFELQEGDLGCLLGPSGCGKSTLLRTISGFQTLTQGRIELDGQELSSTRHIIAPEKRNVGMVFQDHALFPHLTIEANINFGLSKLDPSERSLRTDEMLDLIDMHDYRACYPHEISGGQSQRVALARAIAPSPSLLLMDEPFSNLDTALRESLGYEVRQLLKAAGVTAIMVTHDQHDAFALGDKIGVLADGRLEQWGRAFDLYHTPSSRFVANFIGDGLFVSGKLINATTVQTPFGDIIGKANNEQLIGNEVELLLRPDDVKYDASGPIKATVIRKAFKGAQTLYTLNTESDDRLLSLVPSHTDYEVGDSMNLTIDADHLVCFKRAN